MAAAPSGPPFNQITQPETLNKPRIPQLNSIGIKRSSNSEQDQQDRAERMVRDAIKASDDIDISRGRRRVGGG